MWTLYQGDCREIMAGLEDSSVDAVVTDPPYELGFMGKKWDASGIAYDVGLWREALRVLKPGGHLLAFGGTRTYHRMTCAIEDAGFEIRDSIHWMYGSGFPKSLDVSKAVEKAGSGTSEAQRWGGWGAALKPSHEPIVVARKPLIGTVAANVLEWGTGALNIDGCRVATNEKLGRLNNTTSTFNAKNTTPWVDNSTGKGRWPSNTLFSHLPECGDTCAEGCAVREVDEQSEITVSRRSSGRNGKDAPASTFGLRRLIDTVRGHDDAGGASRFFPAFRYQAKAAPKERKVEGIDARHPTQKPVELMRWLVRLVTPPGGLILDPFTGSGTTGVAALREGFNFWGIEQSEEYCKIAAARIEAAEKTGDNQ